MRSNTYCAAAFNHIYTENDDRYKLCCYSGPNKALAKYNTTKHTPFEYFNSEEMEDIRTQMMSGQRVEGCETCYNIEEAGGQSYRNKVFRSDMIKQTEVGNVELKLRLFGSTCNLGCYMCFPMNSTRRRNDLKQLDDQQNIFKGLKDKYVAVRQQHYQKTIEELLANISLISRIKFTGGEPLMMDRHYEFLFSIPESERKRIHISYDTNFTVLRHGDYTIDHIIDNFPNTTFSVSCDHYGEKLAWIRHPIDVEQFEDNLRRYHKHIHRIQVTASILNALDLWEIKRYYENNFGIKTHVPSVVMTPLHLSIRQLDQEVKEQLKLKYVVDSDSFYAVLNELEKPFVPGLYQKTLNYIDGLNRKRNIQWNDPIHYGGD